MMLELQKRLWEARAGHTHNNSTQQLGIMFLAYIYQSTYPYVN